MLGEPQVAVYYAFESPQVTGYCSLFFVQLQLECNIACTACSSLVKW